MSTSNKAASNNLKGTVKWFSEEKGYGFIVGDDGVERYFHVRNINGIDLPKNGDQVSFVHQNNKKGPRASKVTITAKKTTGSGTSTNNGTSARVDDRPKCDNCGRKMVPRMVFSEGSPSYSVCPFCAKPYQDYREKSGCFIATAVYGDYHANEVMVLRRFRDDTLSRYSAGRKFIRFYYRHSPPIAKWLARHHHLSYFIKKILDFLVYFINNIQNKHR